MPERTRVKITSRNGVSELLVNDQDLSYACSGLTVRIDPNEPVRRTVVTLTIVADDFELDDHDAVVEAAPSESQAC